MTVVSYPLLRFCSNPIPFGRGKKCPFPEGKGYKREGRSVVEVKECKSKEEGGTLPVCKGFCCLQMLM